MRCILHIGTEQTGARSIQHLLGNNSEHFLMQGVGFSKLMQNDPKAITCFSIDELKKPIAVLRDHDMNVEQLDSWRANFEAQWRSEIESLPDAVSTYIISSEFLSWELTSLAELNRIKDFLDPYFDSIEVVVYLTRQDKLARSLYSADLKQGKVNNEIFPSQAGNNVRYNYKLLLLLWANAFGQKQLNVFSYDALQTEHLNVDVHFVEWVLGLTMPDEFEHLKAFDDIDLKAIAIPAYIAFNERFHNPEQSDLALFNQYMEQNYEGKMLESRAEAKAFCQQYEEGNDMIKRAFKLTELFSDDFSEYPEQEAIDYDEVDAIDLGLGYADFIQKNNAQHFTDMQQISDQEGADFYMSLAHYFESIDIRVSLKLMQMAFALRPDDSIMAELKSYQQKLSLN